MSDKIEANLSKTALRIVTRFYPKSFRDRFAAQIAQIFSDMIDDVADNGRSILLVTIASLYDASVGVAQEWTKELVGTMFTIRSATGVALLMFAPFILLIGLSFFNVAPSVLTFDGQQLNNVGRVFVFGSVFQDERMPVEQKTTSPRPISRETRNAGRPSSS